MSTVIRGGTVVNASHSGPADVLIEGEEIVAVGRLGDVDAEEIDASGASCCRVSSTTTRTCRCPSRGRGPPTTTTPARAPRPPAA